MTTAHAGSPSPAASAWQDREAAVKQYMPLVKYVVRRMALRGVTGTIELEDLISHGNVGLIQAIDRYDPTMGIHFETYAVTRIRGAIIDAIRALDGLPRGVRLRANHIEQARTALMFELGRNPTERELRSATGLTAAQYSETLAAAGLVPMSLDEPTDGGDGEEGLSVAETVAARDAVDMTESIERRELLETLAGAVRRLPPRELLVISLRYEKEMTFKDIAEILDVSAGRAGQLHAQAVGRLQRWMHQEAQAA